jgi:hypothetical protein
MLADVGSKYLRRPSEYEPQAAVQSWVTVQETQNEIGLAKVGM